MSHQYHYYMVLTCCENVEIVHILGLQKHDEDVLFCRLGRSIRSYTAPVLMTPPLLVSTLPPGIY